MAKIGGQWAESFENETLVEFQAKTFTRNICIQSKENSSVITLDEIRRFRNGRLAERQ